MARVGLVANPAAGRDIRRLTGGASVVDNYAKRRVAECVLDGLTVVDDPPAVEVMPEKAGIASHAIDEAPSRLAVETVEMPVEESAADTRRAAAHFREWADAVVVLGGDGTTRDVALEVGSVPLVSVSTGTNNVVPTPVDGTVAGAVAAVVATGLADPETVTYRHGLVEATAEDVSGEKELTGLAAVEVTDTTFVGTRAVVDPSDLVGGVVSRAHPADIGLPGIAGCLSRVAPEGPGGAAVTLGDPETADRTVRGIVAPGMTTQVGIEEHTRLDWDEPATFRVDDGVVGADGEREVELVDATVEIAPIPDGPRLVSPRRALEAAGEGGALVSAAPAAEDR
ncbi:MAG: NAD(+)/NADH kinase [Haloarculaceae archaeon]